MMRVGKRVTGEPASVGEAVAVADAPLAASMPKIPALDGLRAVAILIVLASHAGIGQIVPGGFGVTIFFFLSGYLITTLLRLEGVRTGEISLKKFYYNRTVRIFPPMYLTIALVAWMTYAGLIERTVSLPGLVTDALFLTNYAPDLGAPGGVAIPLWSLDVEEHFYIAFSLLFAAMLVRVAARRAAAICLAVALSILLVRLVIVYLAGPLDQIFYWSHTRIDSILWGSVLALWQNPVIDRKAWKPSLPWLFSALLALALCLVIRSPLFRETLRYSVQGAALLVVFSYVIQDQGLSAKLLGNAPLRLVALLSYTLYLCHIPAILFAEAQGFPAPQIVGLCIALAYAGAMYLVVERPLSKLRRHPVSNSR